MQDACTSGCWMGAEFMRVRVDVGWVQNACVSGRGMGAACVCVRAGRKVAGKYECEGKADG